METINCKYCGKLFIHQFGDPLCAKCRSILDEKFDQIKEYLHDNPRASMQQIADANEVSVPQIIKWVREERLEFTQDSLVGVDCSICCTTIKTGFFCKSCKDELAIKLGKAYNKPIPDEIVKELREKSALKFLSNINSR